MFKKTPVEFDFNANEIRINDPESFSTYLTFYLSNNKEKIIMSNDFVRCRLTLLNTKTKKTFKVRTNFFLVKAALATNSLPVYLTTFKVHQLIRFMQKAQ